MNDRLVHRKVEAILLALRNSANTGNVNSTPIGSYQNCLPV